MCSIISENLKVLLNYVFFFNSIIFKVYAFTKDVLCQTKENENCKCLSKTPNPNQDRTAEYQ